MTYADNNNIPYVLLIGSQEIESGELNLKNMKTGEQENFTLDQVMKIIAADSI